MERNKILIIDDNHARLQQARILLKFVGYDTETITVNEIANHENKLSQYLAVILSESLLHDKSANQYEIVLSILKSKQRRNRFILYRENSHEVDKTYADYFIGHLEWPFSQSNLLNILHKATVASQDFQCAADLKAMHKLCDNFVGNTEQIVSVRKLIAQVAKSKATVLITGESGTGKEVAAKLIHELSGRKSQAFVPVNCGAIPSELLESELFGHEKGAFTGAINSRQGRFELAKGGTLFLDEIGDMPLNMQVKLLRVLQEQTFERVGSSKPIQADVRIIAATNTNLEENIATGKFREDLYYRINVFPIELPPLRNRLSDIPLLINNFIEQQASVTSTSIRLLDEAMATLQQYQWPGNVRELYNLVQRLAVLYPNSVVSHNDLPTQFRSSQTVIASLNQQANAQNIVQTIEPKEVINNGIDLKQYLFETEVNFIRQALLDCNWVVSHAAQRLKMRRTTLVEKMRKYGLSRNTDTCSQIIDKN